MRVEQIDKYRGEWCRVMRVSEDGEAVTHPKAMPRGLDYSHINPLTGNLVSTIFSEDRLYRFTTGGPTGGWELFVHPSDVINVTPIKEGT